MPAADFYTKLRAELNDDPLGRGYSGMTDEQAADDLQSEYRSDLKPVPMSSVLRWAARHDALDKLDGASASGVPEQRSVARAATVMINSPHVESFDVHDAELAAMLDALVTAGIFTLDERDDLVALGTTPTSRAAELGLGRVKAGYVGKARA